jgi:hypothetical protein
VHVVVAKLAAIVTAASYIEDLAWRITFMKYYHQRAWLLLGWNH